MRTEEESGLCQRQAACYRAKTLDLDTEAAKVSEATGLAMVRALTVNDHPAFLDMMADVVKTTYRRYEGGTPLPIVPLGSPSCTELPPPAR